MVRVYRMINVTKGEVYHGISDNPLKRKLGFHCEGKTVAVNHWNCEADKIITKVLSSHHTQSKASEVSHQHEKDYKHHRNFKNIKTKGK